MWWNELLRHATGDEHIVFFGDLYAALLGVELADSYAIPHLLKVELLWLVASELNHVKPGDVRLLSVCFEYARRSIEEAFETLEEERTDRACSKVASYALVAMQNSVILTHKSEDLGKAVFCTDKGYVLCVLPSQVVDLQVG